MSDWEQSSTWSKRGNNFLVQIVLSARARSEVDIAMGDGPSMWNIYAYIYPKHFLFDGFDADGGMWQDSIDALELHGGASYFRAHRDRGDDERSLKITSFQVGCDYNHLHDSSYTMMGNDYLDSFKHDAEKLFDKLSADPNKEPQA